MADDAELQIADLRSQLAVLSAPRIAPAVSKLTGQAKAASKDAAASTQQQLLLLSARIRARPLSSVMVAAAAG